MYKYFITFIIILSFFVTSSFAQSADKTKTTTKENTKKTDSQTKTAKTAETDGLKWYDWNEGYTVAAKKNKILVIDIYTAWCGWCKKMDKDTYSKQSIIDMMNKDFVAVKFNPEVPFNEYDIEGVKYNNSQLFGMLCNNQRVGYPTTVFLIKNKKNEWVNYFQSGYQDEANFKKILEYYLTLRDK